MCADAVHGHLCMHFFCPGGTSAQTSTQVPSSHQQILAQYAYEQGLALPQYSTAKHFEKKYNCWYFRTKATICLHNGESIAGESDMFFSDENISREKAAEVAYTRAVQHQVACKRESHNG